MRTALAAVVTAAAFVALAWILFEEWWTTGLLTAAGIGVLVSLGVLARTGSGSAARRGYWIGCGVSAVIAGSFAALTLWVFGSCMIMCP